MTFHPTHGEGGATVYTQEDVEAIRRMARRRARRARRRARLFKVERRLRRLLWAVHRTA